MMWCLWFKTNCIFKHQSVKCASAKNSKKMLRDLDTETEQQTRTQTSRDRPKAAPYLRLKNSKTTSKCQSICELGTFLKNLKSLTMPKQLKGRTLWDFSTSILSQNSKKLKGGPFGGKNFPKKVSECRKNWKGGPLVSPGNVCYAEKK